MTSMIAVAARPEARSRPVDRSFPGNLVTGVCMIVGPVLGVVASALAVGIYDAHGPTFIANMAAHHVRAGWGLNLGPAAMGLMILAVIGVAQRIASVHPRLGRAGGILTVLGLLGPIFFEAIYWGAWHLTVPAQQAAGAYMSDQSQVIPGTIMNVSGPAIVLGFILLGVGAAKAGVLDRTRATLLGLTCFIPFGFISGHILISAVAFACTSLALVPLGARTLRTADVGTAA